MSVYFTGNEEKIDIEIEVVECICGSYVEEGARFCPGCGCECIWPWQMNKIYGRKIS